MSAPANVLLSVSHLSIKFGGLTAVEDLSFEVHQREILSLIGPNGAGKTSAFNAVTGYLAAASGDIIYRGKRINGLSPNAIARLGVVRTFQKTSVFTTQSVLDNVLIGLHLHSDERLPSILLGLPSIGREEKRLRSEAKRLLQFVGLENRAGSVAASLPYGELRLLEVAIALAAKPDLLLLDEPVSGMNGAETEDFMRLLGRISSDGITLLLVEHDMKMVMGASSRIICLNQGRIIADGTPAEIQRNPEVIRAYLGERYARAQG